ncbi:ribonuclease HII [Candidatus Foliamicus sp.]
MPGLFAGVDEAGRGALAGPVVAAAVLLPVGGGLPGARDSKQLTPRQRAALEGPIRAGCLAWAVGLASVQEIDRLNILRASLLAMRRALGGLARRPDLVHVDGPYVPELPPGWAGKVQLEAMIGGDRRCSAIAAASVLAKEWRDRVMRGLDRRWPGYQLGQHKGYGAPAHRLALRRLGASPVHRMSFRPVRAASQD